MFESQGEHSVRTKVKQHNFIVFVTNHHKHIHKNEIVHKHIHKNTTTQMQRLYSTHI